MPLAVGRLRVQFFVKKRLLEVPTIPLEQAHAPLLISTPEATALDLLRYANRMGGVSRAAEMIEKLLERFKKGGLQKALRAESEASNVQRLGYVLQELGRPDLCDIVAEHLPSRMATVLLEKRKPIPPGSVETISERWSVNVNSRLKDSPT